MAEVPVQSNFSYMEGVLSFSYDECAIPSSDAKRLALEKLTGETITLELFIIDEFQEPAKTKLNHAVNLGNVPLSFDLTSQDAATLVLEPGTVQADGTTRPRLLAVFNHTIAIPIASFGRRQNSECDYVQLGQEMNNDDIVATTIEPRLEYVEAIKHILAGQANDQHVTFLSSLVISELEKYRSGAELMLSHALRDYVASIVQKSTHKLSKPIKMLHNVCDEPIESVMELCPIIEKGDLLPDRPSTKIYLEKPATTFAPQTKSRFRRNKAAPQLELLGSINLITLMRGDVAIPLAEFTPSGGCIVTDTDPLTGEATQRSATTTELILLRDFLLNEDVGPGCIRERVKQIEEQIKIRSRYSLHDNVRFIEDKIASLNSGIEMIKGHFISLRQQMSETFSIPERFDRLLGAYHQPTEDLLIKLGALVNQGQFVSVGVLKNLHVKKTTTDADVMIEVGQPDTTTLDIRISARPLSQADVERTTIHQERLSTIRPNSIVADRLVEINEVLRIIRTK